MRRTPTTVFKTIGKNVPIKQMKITLDWISEKKRIPAGIHAIGGIGRNSSMTGKTRLLNQIFQPMSSPSGTPIATAVSHAIRMR
jgi:hypothetical protein